MESRARILGHPIHQIAVFFPLGALGFCAVSDALHARSGRREYADAARHALDFSLIGAAIAMPFGALDWLGIPAGTRAKKVGAAHALGNLAMFGLFAASRLLRSPGHTPRAAKVLSASGMLLSGVTAWLGTELVNRHGVGIHGVVGPNAPSSLSQAPNALRLRRTPDSARDLTYAGVELSDFWSPAPRSER